MVSSTSETANNSCVPTEEQNGSVVAPMRVIETGPSFAVPKCTYRATECNSIFLIGKTERIEAFGRLLYKLKTYISGFGTHFYGVNTNFDYHTYNVIVCRNSILDIPTERRTDGIIMCFDESSYNGRQCLFHLFGKYTTLLSQTNTILTGTKPYTVFTQLMDTIQSTGDAIVFLPERLRKSDMKGNGILWCPTNFEEEQLQEIDSRPIVSQTEMERVCKNRTLTVKLKGDDFCYLVDVLPDQLKKYILTKYPNTLYLKLGPVQGTDQTMLTFDIWGWTTLPTASYGSDRAWSLRLKAINDTVQPSASSPCPPISQTELSKVYHNDSLTVKLNRGLFVYPVGVLPQQLKDHITTNYPGTGYVQFGPSMGKKQGMVYSIWGWSTLPTDSFTSSCEWQTTFESINDTIQPLAPSAPKAVDATPSPSVDATTIQLAALTDAILKLTKLVEAKMVASS
jgi:hypothetical protein